MLLDMLSTPALLVGVSETQLTQAVLLEHTPDTNTSAKQIVNR